MSIPPAMQLRLLHLDDAFAGQPRFLKRCEEMGARQVDARAAGTEVRLWGRSAALQRLQAQIAAELSGTSPGRPSVTWLGSGDFHHVTALLLSPATAQGNRPFTIIHFDNHPDWVACGDDIHCGSWVSHVLQTGIVERVVSLGVTSADLAWPELKRADLPLVASGRLVLFPLNRASTLVAGHYGTGPAHDSVGHRIVWKQFSDQPATPSIRSVLDSIETDAIYITIDKDALIPQHACTNWDQGCLTIDGLLAWLRVVIAGHTIVGVDIVGDYSRPAYGGSAIDVCWKRWEAFVDQPRARATAEEAAHVNEASNLQLLSTLSALLC